MVFVPLFIYRWKNISEEGHIRSKWVLIFLSKSYYFQFKQKKLWLTKLQDHLDLIIKGMYLSLFSEQIKKTFLRICSVFNSRVTALYDRGLIIVTIYLVTIYLLLLCIGGRWITLKSRHRYFPEKVIETRAARSGRISWPSSHYRE